MVFIIILLLVFLFVAAELNSEYPSYYGGNVRSRRGNVRSRRGDVRSRRGDIRSRREDTDMSRTYICLSDQIPCDLVAARLPPNWRRVGSNHRGRIDMVFANGMELMNKRIFPIRATLKPRLDMPDITNKFRLHKHLATIAPDTICESIVVPPPPAPFTLPAGVWMVRSDRGFGGNASGVAASQEEFDKMRAQFQQDPRSTVMISRYITDPLLFDGYKFHLRVYLVAFAGPSERRLLMLDHGLIIPADSKYRAGEWADQAIHDTHAKYNESLKFFPDDMHTLPDGRLMVDEVAQTLARALVPLLPRAKPYPESPAAFELLGADVMFDAADPSRPVAKIIEINSTPGLTWVARTPDKKEMYDHILDMIFAAAGDSIGLTPRPLTDSGIIDLMRQLQ